MKILCVCLAAICLEPCLGNACTVLETRFDRRLDLADAVFSGQVATTVSFETDAGVIRTRAIVRVDQVFKGIVPAVVRICYRGGSVDNRGETDGLFPDLRLGETRLFFVERQRDKTIAISLGASGAPLIHTNSARLALGHSTTQKGTRSEADSWMDQLKLRATARALAGSDLTDQAATHDELESEPRDSGPLLNAVSTATNLFADASGISARFLQPDRGEGIPYYVDADFLPAGMTLTQALEAVQAALDAWASASSLKFSFAGMQSFGMAAADVNARDSALRIQLHDAYGQITGGGEILGRGGNRYERNDTANGWTIGGNVRGNDFNQVLSGWVVLKHDVAAMQNPATFTEVLCHELGHALSLAHSSTDQNESNPVLRQAVMYYMIHADGRGASLNSFDTNVIRQLHPADNTPPFCYDRYIDAITTPTNKPGLNVIRFTGYDLQTTNLVFETFGATANAGVFTFTGNTVSYNATGFFNAPRLAPDSLEFYDLVYTRISDGTNASPYTTVEVLSLNPDTYYEGIPDAWRLAHFGSADPASGPNRRALQDYDADGFSNDAEWKLGSDPADKNSNLHLSILAPGVLQWQAMPYELYEIEGSTAFENWQRVGTPILPTSADGMATISPERPQQFFRIRKIQ